MSRDSASRATRRSKKATVYFRWMRKHGDSIACYLSLDEHELERMRQIVKCENHCRAKGAPRVKLVKVRITEVK